MQWGLYVTTSSLGVFLTSTVERTSSYRVGFVGGKVRYFWEILQYLPTISGDFHKLLHFFQGKLFTEI